MAIKTFMTNEEDRQAIINESKRQKVTFHWDINYPYREGDLGFSEDEFYAILDKSENYDIVMHVEEIAAGLEIDVPVKVCNDTLVGVAYSFTDVILEPEELYYFSWNVDRDINTIFFSYRKVDKSASNPCLIEGTPINMADGTTKPIELVRSGDLVLSYDPNTETQVPAVVLDAYPTGAERKYTVYNFSNGKHLTIFGLHGYYDKVSGTTQDIRDINRDKRLIDIEGNVIQWAGSRDRYFAGEKKVRYNIITSNNLYYANGILLGSRPYNKLQYYLDRGITLPEEIKSVWQQDCDDHNVYDDVISDASFYAEVAEDYQELAKAKNIIRVNKKRLERTDYQNAKQVEGLLTDEEWNKSKDKRFRYRKEINDNEFVYKERLSHVNEVIARYRKDMTAKTIFEACCERDNAIFETVKAYFHKNNI